MRGWRPPTKRVVVLHVMELLLWFLSASSDSVGDFSGSEASSVILSHSQPLSFSIRWVFLSSLPQCLRSTIIW